MTKSNIAIFFTVIFMTFIVVPPVLSMIDKEYQQIVNFNVNEEENKTSNVFEIIAENVNHFSLTFEESNTYGTVSYQFKTYPKPHLNLISPPPEIYIL